MKILEAPLSVALVILHLDEDLNKQNSSDFYHNFIIRSCASRGYIPELLIRKTNLVFIVLPDTSIIAINNNTYELKAYGFDSSHKVHKHIKQHNI